MPPAGEAAIVRDGVACVDAGGVAVTDPECVCGAPSCTGCPCCVEPTPRHCAPPGVSIGDPNVQRVRVDAEQTLTLTGQPPSHAAYSIDSDLPVRCGTFGFQINQLRIQRGVALVDLPSDPGLKWWDNVRIESGEALAGPVEFFSRPGATWWLYNGLDQGTPSGPNPGGPGTKSATVTMNPCLTRCEIDYDQNGPGFTVQRHASFEMSGAWLPCPSSSDAPCEDCLDGFAPRAQGPGAGA